MLSGPQAKTFEIGDATRYTPVNVSFGNVSVAGNLTASTTAGDHANIGTSAINAAKSVNRYWTLTNSGITFTNYSATFTFVAGDIDGGASTSSFIVGKYSAGWTYPTVGTKTGTTTQITGVTSFSDFQIGELGTITWDGGAGTNNWGDANNWNPDVVPTSSNDVSLTGANTIDVNVAGVCNNLTLNNASLVLTVKSAYSLTVSGNLTLTTGTLNTEASFPTVTGTTTLYSRNSRLYRIEREPDGCGTELCEPRHQRRRDEDTRRHDYTERRPVRQWRHVRPEHLHGKPLHAGGTLTVANGATLEDWWHGNAAVELLHTLHRSDKHGRVRRHHDERCRAQQ